MGVREHLVISQISGFILPIAGIAVDKLVVERFYIFRAYLGVASQTVTYMHCFVFLIG